MPHTNVTGAMGALGFGIQTAKEAVATVFQYMRAQEVALAPNNIARQEEPTVGGNLFPGTVYKAGVVPAGGITFQALSEAWGIFLYGLAGAKTVAGEAVPYTHTFKPAASHDSIPWLTVKRNLGDGSCEQFLDCRVAGGMITMAATQPVGVQMNIVGRVPSVVAAMTPALDDTPLLLTVGGSATVDSGFRLSGDTALYARSIQFAFGHQVSDDDFIIGSPYLDDVTLLYRTLGVTIRTKLLASDALYKAVYYGGGTSWSAVVEASSVVAVAKSAANIPTTQVPYELSITVSNIEFLAVPIAIRPGLVALELSGVLSYSGSGDPYAITLKNDLAAYVDAA